jgi:hypothetical protein
MAIFKVSCSWEVYSTMNIEANSLTEAIAIAESDDYPLPTEAFYIDGSFNVDIDMSKELNRKD